MAVKKTAKGRTRIINAIDVGTSKVCTIIARVDDQNEIDILGMGVSGCDGMKKGLVVDLDSVTRSIYRSVNEAEKMAECVVDSAYVGLSGAHVTSASGHGVTNVFDPHAITYEDTRRAMEATRYLMLPPDREIVDIIGQEYVVDGHDGVRDPAGMSGARLDVHVQIITGASASIQNLVKCVTRLDIAVKGLIPAPLASAEAALNDDEKEIGVVALDIGAGTTDMAMYKKGSLAMARVFPVGGGHIDNDIAIGLSTSTAEAERVKIRHGRAFPDGLDDGRPVEMKLVGREGVSQVPGGLLCEIIYPRVTELFELALRELERESPIVAIPAGVVITGGTAALQGIVTVAEKVLNTHIRLGAPRGVRSQQEKIAAPIYSTAVGLVRCAASKYSPEAEQEGKGAPIMKMAQAATQMFRGLFK